MSAPNVQYAPTPLVDRVSAGIAKTFTNLACQGPPVDTGNTPVN